MRERTLARGYWASLLGACALVGLLREPAAASEFEVHPTFTAREEYNDNLYEDVTAKRSDFITTLQPGLALRYHSSALTTEGGYGFEYRNYARGTRTEEYNHTATLTGQAALVPDFFIVDFSESLTRVSLDVARDRTQESSFFNQTDQNAAVISPYFVWRIGEKGSLRTGYRYLDTRYWSPDGIDKQDQIGFAEFQREVGTRTTFNGSYSFSHTKAQDGSYDRQDATGGLRYQYAERSFVFGAFGNSWFSFDRGKRFSNLTWNAGITHDFGTVVGTVETRVQYAEDPLTLATRQTSYGGRIEKEFGRGALGAFSTYTEYVLAETNTLDRRQLAGGLNGRYELAPKLTATALLTGDRTSRKVASDFPYHFNATGTLAYTCNYDVSVAATYTYAVYRMSLGSDRGAMELNRVIVEVRKAF